MLRQIIKTRQTSLILLAGGVCGDDVIRLLVHIAGNVVCYYFKIRPAATLIFSLNVSIFHSGWCEEVGVDS